MSGGLLGRAQRALEETGSVAVLGLRFVRTLFTTRFDWRSFVYQVEQLGVRSLAIASATAVFVGMVMAIQFGFFMEKYGAKEALGKVISISEARELAPALTSLVVGSRIAAGMAAELGSMSVTEQIDAIRALGADPIRKLVVPRVVASIVIMPLIAAIALLLGLAAAMFIANVSYGIPVPQFISAALDGVTMQDYLSGLSKTPVFGFLIAILGCYFGMGTRGGTEGVGRSTTRSVVVVSITILVADALLTQIFVAL
ncbi:MAG TPA: ABC transporter permease [Polyangiaceae bacterium LLY-WYZ-15_(1-7)]|nr:transporter [Myxococcales bacterium]MAT25449.1 transporter [Sandaracinus sp.]HJL00681.1 ABC transporter permease [Polyangiaceae bacterium LLY-WYZ-15_(1-7)]MBJ73922.1 transporter [Sandaracinus sp.]HJL08967.1 ABC transporter permease [Polyangiaceae bacterium LLY-WYZ-15_(1-7)]